MRKNRRRSLWLGVSILAVLIGSSAVLGQSVPAPEVTIPLPNDWSHRHVIFSKPATKEQAERVEKDPRYWQQRYRRELPILSPAAETGDSFSSGSSSGVKVLHSGVDASPGDWQENLGSGGGLGASNYPAKFTFLLSTANCASAPQPDFVIYSSGLEGSSTQASIVAYDNIYSGCTGTVPMTYWAYNTGGQILTSPVYSDDGTQLAFVQTNTGLEGNLVLLKWAASTTEKVGSPMTLTSESTTLYASCSHASLHDHDIADQ